MVRDEERLVGGAGRCAIKTHRECERRRATRRRRRHWCSHGNTEFAVWQTVSSLGQRLARSRPGVRRCREMQTCISGNRWNRDARRSVEMRVGPGKVQSMTTLQLGRRCFSNDTTKEFDGSTSYPDGRGSKVEMKRPQTGDIAKSRALQGVDQRQKGHRLGWCIPVHIMHRGNWLLDAEDGRDPWSNALCDHVLLGSDNDRAGLNRTLTSWRICTLPEIWRVVDSCTDLSCGV